MGILNLLLNLQIHMVIKLDLEKLHSIQRYFDFQDRLLHLILHHVIDHQTVIKGIDFQSYP